LLRAIRPISTAPIAVIAPELGATSHLASVAISRSAASRAVIVFTDESGLGRGLLFGIIVANRSRQLIVGDRVQEVADQAWHRGLSDGGFLAIGSQKRVLDFNRGKRVLLMGYWGDVNS
jgi:hypothetical protein